MSANIREGRCKYECRRTFHGAWGPGGRNPGTHGRPGEVRRCKHGRIWQFARNPVYAIDEWVLVDRFWEPVVYRRAKRALAAASSSASGER